MVSFGTRQIGEGHPCFITFEAGPTHNGLESAKALVSQAAAAGGDAVKFQILDPDRLVADRRQPFSYEVLTDRETGASETVTEPLYNILCRRALSTDEWREVKLHADNLGLAFFATIAFDDEVAFLEDLNCASIKIASADVNHIPLLRRAARSGMCLQLDTGNATIGEIEQAVDVIRQEGNENIIIHQCPSGYPARLDSINLNIIPTLKRMFGYPVAYSDHTPGWEIDIAAVALGANVIEKTITPDRTTRSVEHIMSLEPSEMSDFVRSIRDVETALGSPRRIMSNEERTKRQAVRRSAFLKRAVIAGESLDEADIEFRRPGYGVTPDRLGEFDGARFAKDLPAGHQLRFTDLAFNG
jgi:sialic acid synthase SpsE